MLVKEGTCVLRISRLTETCHIQDNSEILPAFYYNYCYAYAMWNGGSRALPVARNKSLDNNSPDQQRQQQQQQQQQHDQEIQQENREKPKE